jgi:hypothetical protein
VSSTITGSGLRGAPARMLTGWFVGSTSIASPAPVMWWVSGTTRASASPEGSSPQSSSGRPRSARLRARSAGLGAIAGLDAGGLGGSGGTHDLRVS